MRLFLYGTLLQSAVLARRTGRMPKVQPCEAPGWRRVQLRGTPYPTLRRAPGAMAGGLIEADARAVGRLHAYEGMRYRFRQVRVRAGGRSLTAHVWIAAAATNRPWP